MNQPVRTLVLRRKELQPSKRERAIVAVVGILLLIASLIFLFLGAKDWFAFAKGLWQETAPSRRISLVTELILVLLVGLLAHWSRRRSKEHEQLVLDASGIHYASPMPSALASLQPSWNHSWADIRSAQIVIPKVLAHPNLVSLVLDVGATKRIITGQWVPANDQAERQGVPACSEESKEIFFASEGRAAQLIAQALDQSPVLQYIRRMGVKIFAQPAPDVDLAPVQAEMREYYRGRSKR